MERYSPEWNKDVYGEYPPRTFDEDGMPEPQRVYCKCTICDAEYVIQCLSGQVRQHISKFAKVHLHKDPFGVSK